MATTQPDAVLAGTPIDPRRPEMDAPAPLLGRLIFFGILLAGLGFAGFSIFEETSAVGSTLAFATILLLSGALLIALGFEFVNGFHDTANAVATVIYTNAMPAPLAVVWSGFFNFLGVLLSSGAVAFAIVTLLPVELILNVGNGAGYAMIFALLLAAVIWNLATWFVGLPNSSSHALIGSILGVGLANQWLSTETASTAGVDWSQAEKVLAGLLISPVIGFFGAMLLLIAMKRVIRNPKLYQAPDRDAPPPRGIRALLIFTCTAVSFAHGQNDGQKGMGLIMLILIGCAPAAYAINRAPPKVATAAFLDQSATVSAVFGSHAGAVLQTPKSSRHVLASALRTKNVNDTVVFAAIEVLSHQISDQVSKYGALAKVPAGESGALRNDMYLVLDTSRLILKSPRVNDSFSAGEVAAISAYQASLEDGTRFIPTWVKVAVALALGLGTMVGWKRIVITVGEKIGKTHMTYGMGAAAEMMAAATILLAEGLHLPVSTTHILSSGVAGASVGNGTGLQPRTIGAIVLAWVLTLPAVMALSGGLYWLFLSVVRAMGTA